MGYRGTGEPAARVSASRRFELPMDIRRSNPAAAIRRNSPAAYQRVDSAAQGQRVLLAHQNDEAATFSRPETGGALVENAHLIGSQSACFGKADQLERVEAQVHAAGKGNVQVASGQ